MKKPDKCNIEYCGYNEPKTHDELEMEILGLNNAIKSAEVRISSLIQSKFYAEAFLRSSSDKKTDDNLSNGHIVEEGFGDKKEIK